MQEIHPGGPKNVELDVALRRHRGKLRFAYTLRAEDLHRSFESPWFLDDPNAFHERLTSVVERSLQGLGPGREPALRQEIGRRLRSHGQDLCQELLPEAMRELFQKLCQELHTLLIRSQEPWIPWEMLVPGDGSTPAGTEPLAAICGLTRWLPKAGPPPPAPAIGPILLIQAAAGGHGPVLTAGEAEQAALTALAERLGVERIVLDHPTVDEVEAALLDCRPGIVHASAHGSFEALQPGDAALWVGGRRPFRPGDLTRDLRRALRRARPLVFLNACQLGRQGWALTGLGGWAKSVLGAHASAFLAPIWTVKDRLAALFAEVFYRHLGHGETLAAAALAARRAVRSEEPDLPTWLGYQVYGHPTARLRPAPEATAR